jgi:type I restriction enzyme M protein
LEDFAVVVSNEEVLEKKGNMAINRYVRQGRVNAGDGPSFENAYAEWEASSNKLKDSMSQLFATLEGT